MVMCSGDDATESPRRPAASVTALASVGGNADKGGQSIVPHCSRRRAGRERRRRNCRQDLSPILAASAGALVGAGTGTIVIKDANVPVTGIMATIDNVVNCTMVSLSLPI